MTLFLQHVTAGAVGYDYTRLIATLGLFQTVLYPSNMTCKTEYLKTKQKGQELK